MENPFGPFGHMSSINNSTNNQNPRSSTNTLKIKPLIVRKPTSLINPLIYRKLYPNITAEWLDKHYGHYLLSGEDSWNDIPRRYWFKIKFKPDKASSSKANTFFLESWWDIRQLLLQITQCLNCSNMGNSYPQFPHDPFTRRPIPYDELSQIYDRAIELQLKIHCSTLVFLYWLRGKNHRKQNNRWKKTILDTKQLNMILGTWLRYRNINSQDSQGNFIGIWEPKSREIDLFERTYRQYCQHPPFIFEFGIEIINPRRKILEDLLQRLPREEWDPEQNAYPAGTNPYLFNPKRSPQPGAEPGIPTGTPNGTPTETPAVSTGETSSIGSGTDRTGSADRTLVSSAQDLDSSRVLVLSPDDHLSGGYLVLLPDMLRTIN